MDTLQLFGIPLKREVDIGHLLTFLTLTAGFIWWLYTNARQWRRNTLADAEEGALRLLLALLRQREGAPVELRELMKEFNSPELFSKRKAYCKRNFCFKTEDRFEAAVYALDWEGKVDFVGTHSVAFHVDKEMRQAVATAAFLVAADNDQVQVLRILSEGLEDINLNAWDLRGTVRTALTLAPEVTAQTLRAALSHQNPVVQRRAAELMSELFAVR